MITTLVATLVLISCCAFAKFILDIDFESWEALEQSDPQQIEQQGRAGMNKPTTKAGAAAKAAGSNRVTANRSKKEEEDEKKEEDEEEKHFESTAS